MEVFKKKIERNYFLQGIIFKKNYVEKKKSFEIEIFEYDFFQKGRFFSTDVFKKMSVKNGRSKKKKCEKIKCLVKEKVKKVFLFRRCVF